jgi:hypothetical protein
MSRYLPDRYEPIPDELLRSGANLWDVTRRINRNQNWIWANQGAVFAAWGQEPLGAQEPVLTGAGQSLIAGRFAAPLLAGCATDRVRVTALVSVSGTTTVIDGRVRLYQLFPGETEVSSATHYDETPVTSSGTSRRTFSARVVSGQNPARFAVGLATGATNTATITLISVHVEWDRDPVALTAARGETVENWTAISQSFAAPDRAASAAFLRALSNRTLGLLARSPRLLYSHCFLWPRVSSTTVGWAAEARYPVPRDFSLFNPQWFVSTVRLRYTVRVLVTGQNATSTVSARYSSTNAGGTPIEDFEVLGTTSATTLVNGAYVREQELTGVVEVNAYRISQGGSLGVQASVATAAVAGPAYVSAVGVAILGVTISVEPPLATELGLPGADTVPASYVPLDDAACAPGRSVLAQDDRFGVRAGPYYLVRNLIWLAANRTGVTLVADWLHRTQSAGWSGAGDGYYRNQTLVSTNGQQYPAGGDVVPWTSAANPTNAATVASGGQHYPGIVLATMDCRPLNGGRVGVLARPEILAMPGASPTNETFTALWADIGAVGSGANLGTVSTAPANIVGGFLRLPTGSVKPTAGQDLRIRGTMQNDTSDSDGRIIALHSLYAYEEPLTQADLDAL